MVIGHEGYRANGDCTRKTGSRFCLLHQTFTDTLQFLFAAAMGVMKAMAFIDEQ
jgi:hypothetical protein